MPVKKMPMAATSVPGNKQALFRVARAAPKDVGRGLARLNRADMEHLGVTVGDMVTVTCRERATVLKVMSVVARRTRPAADPDGRRRPRERRRPPR